MRKRRLHRLVRVYTCENATLLEITCNGIAPVTQLRTCVMKIVHIQGRSPNKVSDFPYQMELS